MGKNSEYEHLYVLRNQDTGNLLLYYWASSQKHKAIFSSLKKAEDALFWLKDMNVKIEEI